MSHFIAKYFLEYGNSGDVDMPAPVFEVSTDSSLAFILCVVFDPLPVFQETITVFGKGSDAMPGILPPGSSFSIPLELKTSGSELFNLQVSVIGNDPMYEQNE